MSEVIVVGSGGDHPVNVEPNLVGVPGLVTDNGDSPNWLEYLSFPKLLSNVAVTVVPETWSI